MSEIDKEIRDALSEHDRELLEHFGEQGLIGQLGGLFQGKLAWLSVLTMAVGFAVFIVGVYAAWRFTNAGDIASMLSWGGIAWAGFTGMMMIKIWSWMRMETNRTLREIKRLELQIARMRV